MAVNPTKQWDKQPIYGWWKVSGVGNTITLEVADRIRQTNGRLVHPGGVAAKLTIGDDAQQDPAARSEVRAALLAIDEAAAIAAGETFDRTAWDVAWDANLQYAIFTYFENTDDPNVTPNGWQVKVTEGLTSGKGKWYYVSTLSDNLSLPVPGINLSDYEVPPGSPTVPAPIYAKGQPGGVAALDLDGDVVDSTGAKVGGGVTSYGSLTDVPTAFPPSAHSHATSDVTGLDTALAGKAASSHTHATSQVTGLDTALAGKAATSHAHATSDVTGLDTALAGKASTAAATTSAAGLVELATTTEATTGTDTTRAVTPAGLKAVADTKAPTTAASESAAGLVELATTTEARTGTDTARAVTPAGMAGFAMKYVALSGVTLSGRFVVAPDGATYTGGADKITGDIVATLAP